MEFYDERIETLQREIARELGFELVGHRLELYGHRARGKGTTAQAPVKGERKK